MDRSIAIILRYSDSNELSEENKQVLAVIQSALVHNFNGLLSNNQLQALISLVYDIGLDTFFETSIPEYIMANKLALVRREILSFNRIGRVASAVLTARRSEELTLFCEA